jgi:hypothetical protein
MVNLNYLEMSTMISNKKYFLFYWLVGLLSLGSCKDDHFNGIVEGNTAPPGPVTNVQVTNDHGKAILRYTLPGDDDLLYVKAEYPLPNGQMRVIKSSQYSNELIVDGFANTNPYQIKLYAVNKSEVSSVATDVTVQPKEPIFNLVFDQIQVTPSFGGVRIRSLNTLKGSVVVVPMVDSLGTGEYVQLDSYYTEDSLINYNVRGLKPEELKFAFYVRDRWLNTSDTLFASVTPLEENLLDRNLFQAIRLPNDADFRFDTNLPMLWDGNLSIGKWPSLYTQDIASSPTSLTFSIGKEAKISRVVVFPRRENGFYDKGNLREFEIWASNEYTQDGSWDSWTKLASCLVVKPSGTPVGTSTAADEAAGTIGWSFDMPEDALKYKYLRIRNLRNWQGSYFMQIRQIQIWGVY